ncbi:hypothetical protein OROHE_012940 [Orobanche hederae]
MDELSVPNLSLCTPDSKNSRDGITNHIGLSPNHVLVDQDPLVQLTFNQIVRLDTTNLLESKGGVGRQNYIAGSSIPFSIMQVLKLLRLRKSEILCR